MQTLANYCNTACNAVPKTLAQFNALYNNKHFVIQSNAHLHAVLHAQDTSITLCVYNSKQQIVYSNDMLRQYVNYANNTAYTIS